MIKFIPSLSVIHGESEEDMKMQHWCDNEECLCRTCTKNELRRSTGDCGSCTVCDVKNKNYHGLRRRCYFYRSANNKPKAAG